MPHPMEAAYEEQEMVTQVFHDKPNEVSPPHAHHSITLYVIGGTIEVTLVDKETGAPHEPILMGPDEELVIGEGQTHSAVAGPEGCEYIGAWYEEDAVRYASQTEAQ